MFFFGSVEDQADAYMQSEVAGSGRRVADCHYEEMSQKEARVALVHARMALRSSQLDGAPLEVQNELLQRYEEVLLYMIPLDKDIQRAIEVGAYRPPVTKGHINKVRAAFTEVTGRSPRG